MGIPFEVLASTTATEELVVATGASTVKRSCSRARSLVRGFAAAAIMASLLVAAAMSPVSAGATTLERISVEQAASRASTVFVGTVVGTRVERSAEGVRTAVRLWVGESLKGDASGVITVYVPGGHLPDGSDAIVDSMAVFSPGEECCVSADDRGWVLGGYQGKIHLAQPGLGTASAASSAAMRRVRAACAASSPAAEVAPGGARTLTKRPPSNAPQVVEAAAEQPTITSVTPGSASAGTHSKVTISGSGFGPAPGKVEFALDVYGVERIAADTVLSWSDAQIECEVPTGTIGGFSVCAGSGPLVVTEQGGAESNAYEFSVPFGYAGLKWPSPAATYLVNATGIDVERRTRLVDAAADSWNSAGSAFRFVDGGDTGLAAVKDGVNVITWSGTLPAGVVAMTWNYKDASGLSQECDVQFNSAIPWAEGVGDGSTDIQTIAVHEFGHWLCLLDQYTPGDADKVMYGFEALGQRRELTLGDIAGIRWVYPAPSGSLHVTVIDAGGAPLPGATVAVDSCQPLKSGADGSVTVTGVPTGINQVVCSLAGYTTQVFSATIVAGDTTNAEVALQTGEMLPVYRFFQRRIGSHFYTASATERDSVKSNLADVYTFEGTAYTLNVLDPANSTPLYRFFNKKNGSHFYTASLAERDSVYQNLSATYSYDGPGYLVSDAPKPGTVPVFRFFNRRNGSHFYTTSPAEKTAVIRTLAATYTYEGPAFWIAP